MTVSGGPAFPAGAACTVRQVRARVIVDGAHAAGNLPSLDVPAMGADFYVTNLHQWACAPKGAALLWAAPAHQQQLLPVVVSHGYGMVRRQCQHGSRHAVGCRGARAGVPVHEVLT